MCWASNCNFYFAKNNHASLFQHLLNRVGSFVTLKKSNPAHLVSKLVVRSHLLFLHTHKCKNTKLTDKYRDRNRKKWDIYGELVKMLNESEVCWNVVFQREGKTFAFYLTAASIWVPLLCLKKYKQSTLEHIAYKLRQKPYFLHTKDTQMKEDVIKGFFLLTTSSTMHTSWDNSWFLKNTFIGRRPQDAT